MATELPISFTIEDVDPNDVSAIRFFFSDTGDPTCEVKYFVKKTTGEIYKSGTYTMIVDGDAKTDIVAWFTTYVEDAINTIEGFLP